ncbi:MAG: peptidase T4 [Robiginitomaculum sp.]|nr:MAG: peptidase T4 [Robiginitomaculum sp.]
MSQKQSKNLLTDIAGITVGNASCEQTRTGVTVIRCETPMVCAVDVAGGGPGTRETDALAPENLVETVDAIVLTGGSVYGLAAADGVISVLGAAGAGFGLVNLPGVPKSPIVPSAVLYDLANGGDKNWGETPPYWDLGRQALSNVSDQFALGNIGAGTGALAGAIKGGLGSASVRTQDGFQVAALVAVNCFGSVLMPGTSRLWAEPFGQDDEFRRSDEAQEPITFDLEDWGAAKVNPAARQNTTLAVVATDLPLTPAQAKRMAKMASAGMARAIRPIAAPFDGDVTFALASGTHAAQAVDAFTLARVGALAADCLSRAIGRGVMAATTMEPHLCLSDWRKNQT